MTGTRAAAGKQEVRFLDALHLYNPGEMHSDSIGQISDSIRIASLAIKNLPLNTFFADSTPLLLRTRPMSIASKDQQQRSQE
jgi:hypothetical protein